MADMFYVISSLERGHKQLDFDLFIALPHYL